MDIAAHLSMEMSRRNTDFISNIIGNDSVLFAELIDILFEGEDPLPSRASWAISAVTDRYPDLLNPYFEKIVKNLKTFKPTGIHRNLLRQISKMNVPEELEGILFDLCYQWLLSKNEPPAVKVHCMQILFNISEKEHDLKPELFLIFQDLMNHESAAIRSRCKHLLMK